MHPSGCSVKRVTSDDQTNKLDLIKTTSLVIA